MAVALPKHKAGGRTATEIRQALIRRVRYPVLSAQAAAIGAARILDTDAAWRAAWIDRYGIGPDSTRRERCTARTVLARQSREDRKAARKGEQRVQDGMLTRPERSPVPAAERSLPSARTLDGAYIDGGIAEFEDLLRRQVSAHEQTLEPPAVAESERPNADTSTQETETNERSNADVSGKNERSSARGRGRKVSARPPW